VLEQFPDLVLNLAHFDRLGSRWRRTIEALIKHHAWVFTDISYALELLYAPWHFVRTLHKLLKAPATRSRILYGTDWYMGGCFWTESSYQRKLRGKASGSDGTPFRLSSDEMHRLTDTNPRHFLAGSPDRF
jgi:predicted TIM-barrel fold metal-dependent hydrolase